MKHLNKYKEFLLENNNVNNTDTDNYSGEYENSVSFILDNYLEKEFENIYGKLTDKYSDIYEYIRDIGNDEEVIKELLPDNHYLFYDEMLDKFIITKKKNIEIEYEIIQSNKYNNDILTIFKNVGLLTEYEPRFSVLYNDEVIGGTTKGKRDGAYSFDIAILDEYQGYGISKKLINKIIEDAKMLGYHEIYAEVVNTQLSKYLESIGFDVSQAEFGYHAYFSM